jgi:transposase
MFLGSLSIFLGHGSAKEISDITGVTQQTLAAGRRESRSSDKDPHARPTVSDGRRIRSPGGGRKKITETQPEILSALMELMEGNIIGDPESTITWTTKSTTNLAKELSSKGFTVSHDSVGNLLKEAGFSLQQNKKYTESGDPGPDRD